MNQTINLQVYALLATMKWCWGSGRPQARDLCSAFGNGWIYAMRSQTDQLDLNINKFERATG